MSLTVEKLAGLTHCRILNLSEPDRPVRCGYAGDLLSWVMSHAKRQCAWMTVLSHVNVIAVAVMAEVSAVVVCEKAEVTPEVIRVAQEQRVNLLQTEDDEAGFCIRLQKILSPEWECEGEKGQLPASISEGERW